MSVINLAIDMGTSMTNIYQLGSGVVLSEPSVVAVSSAEREVKAVGLDAKRLIGKTAENTSIIFPVSEGLISDENMAVVMLSYFLKKIQAKGFMKKIRAAVSVPCGLESVELYKFAAVLRACGIRDFDFIENPICCALGMNVPLTEFSPCFTIDMGGGCTNIAALSLDGIIAGMSVNMGGGNVDAQIIDYIAYKYNLKIGLLTAERVKMQIGSLLENDATSAVINGRDVETGRPRSVSLTAAELFPPLKVYYDKTIEMAWKVMKKLPAEVSAEIRHAGLYVTGGCSAVAGLDYYVKEKLEMEINLCEAPETSAVTGAGILLGNYKLLDKVKTEIQF